MNELADRLKQAARAETFAINQLEYHAAREDLDRERRLMSGDLELEPAVFGPALSNVKRQAMALAMAAKLAEALRARPELALGLGITALEL